MIAKPLPALALAAMLAAVAPGRPSLAAPVYTFTSFQIAGAPYTFANGINDSGQVVGYTQGPGGSAFIYNSVTGATTLFALPGAYGNTIPTAINNAGEIVGIDDGNAPGSSVGGVYGDRSFSRDPSGTVYTILSVPAVSVYPSEPTGNDAYGINDAGQIVGSLGGGPPPSYARGFLLDPVTGAVTVLTVLPVVNTTAYDINNLGQIVGNYVAAPDFGDGFLRDPTTGAYTTLKDPAGTGTQARGINDVGQIVGIYSDAAFQTQGLLYDIASGTYTIVQDPNAAGPTIVTGINNAGQIVGYYEDVTGNYDGFVATPLQTAAIPEPATLALLGASVAGLLAWRRSTFG